MKKLAFFCCVIALALFSSCRMVETLAGNESAGTVDNLWADVPEFAGAEKADLAIPLGARLIIRTAMQGKVNFIAFTTNYSSEDVQGFYAKDRMEAEGWTIAEKGCIGDKDESSKSTGAVCLFERRDGGKEEGLAIIVAEDTETRKTNIFYVRIDTTPEKKEAAATSHGSV